jgi:hypothetical protein
MKYFILILFTTSLGFSQDPDLTNNGTGIDAVWSGVKEVDYMEEYLYHDKNLNDWKVVYIKGTTSISLSHNAYNAKSYSLVGQHGPDGVPDSGDEGRIRYAFDGDLSSQYFWSDHREASTIDKVNSLYTGPFTVASAVYPDGVTSVIGSTGGVGNIKDSGAYYGYGVIGPSGDEWHTFNWGDDDWSELLSKPRPNNLASDGALVWMVVNPLTPAMTITTTGDAEFYTRPPKAFNIPNIVEQMTVIDANSGSVNFKIKDINGNNIFYRIVSDRDDVGTAYTSVGADQVILDDADFSTGTQFLQYYYNPSNVKTREVIKNPTYPSSSEGHGNKFWVDASGWSTILDRIQNLPPYSTSWASSKAAWNAHYSVWDLYGGTRIRFPWHSNSTGDSPYHQSFGGAEGAVAFIGLVEGGDEVPATGDGKSYFEYAKEMLFGNIWTRVHPIGFNVNQSSDPYASPEVAGAGYYVNNQGTEMILAYEILIANFREEQTAGGITPVEDYYIRDQLGRFMNSAMAMARGIKPQDSPTAGGMWDTARHITGMQIAYIMSEYSSPIYGTSGMGVNQTTYPWTPWRDDQYTAKEVYYDYIVSTLDDTDPDYGFPNLGTYDFQADVLWTSDGNWGGPNNKLGYADLMASEYGMLLNLVDLGNGSKTWNRVELGVAKATAGTLTGSGGGDGDKYIRFGMVGNSRMGSLGVAVVQAVQERISSGAAVQSQFPWGYIWYDDTIANGIPNPPPGLNNRKVKTSTSRRGILFFLL